MGNYTVSDPLLEGRNTKRKMTGPDLNGITGVEVGEVDFSANALIHAREPDSAGETGAKNPYRKEGCALCRNVLRQKKEVQWQQRQQKGYSSKE